MLNRIRRVWDSVFPWDREVERSPIKPDSYIWDDQCNCMSRTEWYHFTKGGYHALKCPMWLDPMRKR